MQMQRKQESLEKKKSKPEDVIERGKMLNGG